MPTAREIIGVERAESLRIMDEKHYSFIGLKLFFLMKELLTYFT